MAFIGSNPVLSYATAEDLRDRDQRFFEANDGIAFAGASSQLPAPADLDEYLEDLAIRSTQRINQKIRASSAWREYMNHVGIENDINNIPDINPDLIIDRKEAFTDMCVYYTFKEYLMPKMADFTEDSPELVKIRYYENKFEDLFTELTSVWDWYDVDGDGTVSESEKLVAPLRTRRSRGRRARTYVR